MKSETDAQPVVAATAMTPAEREEFEEFQRYRAWRAQQTAPPAATQVAAAQYPQQPQPQHLTMMQSYPQQHQQQVIMYPEAAIEARETRCCCSLVCALVNAAAWSGVFMVLGLITVGLGWSSGVYGTYYYGIAPFMSIAPGLITLFPQLIIVGSSGAQAGCYRHCQGCSSGRPCFAGRPHGRKGCQLMTAFYVIGGVAFVMLCNTWVCLYGVGVYCGVTSLVQLIAHCLAFAATLKFLHEVKHPNPAQPPAAAAIPAGIHMQPVQQQYPPPPHLGHPEAVAQQVPYPVAQGV